MKRVFLAIGIAAILPGFVSANAGLNKSDKESRKQLRKERREERKEVWLHSVNTGTEAQFYRDFPQAKNVSWTEGAFAEATFDDGAITKTAYYDLDDDLVGTTNMVDYLTLPNNARKEIEEKYPGYNVERVILFDDNEFNDTDMYLFNHAFDDEDTYFAVIGNDTKEVILKITLDGFVSFFKNYK